MSDTLPLGAETVWGKVQAVGTTGGERYYWLVDRDGGVSMMPAFVVEPRADDGCEDCAPVQTERIRVGTREAYDAAVWERIREMARRERGCDVVKVQPHERLNR